MIKINVKGMSEDILPSSKLFLKYER